MGGDPTELRTELEALFLEELQDDIRVLTDGLADLGRDTSPSDAERIVQDMFRAAHGLKGAAHSAGNTAAVGPCHRLEEVLAAVRAGDRELDADLVAALTDDVDALIALEREIGSASRAAPAAAGRERGRARVAVTRLDLLVDQTATLLTTAQQVDLLVEDISAARAHTRGADGGRAVSDILDRLATRASSIDRELDRGIRQVANTAQQLRLQLFADVTVGLESAVRELSATTGKQVELVVEGSDVELDREVGDALREPLLHLVRNAVDHGIEPPADRVAARKSSLGTVRVAAVVTGPRVRVTVSDDGDGIDVDALAILAEHRGSAERGPELAFLSGVSTAMNVTAVSGRGIGLDAVRARVESLSGTIQLRTERGRGTDVEIHVPVTLAVLRVLVASVGGGERVAVPVANIARLHRIRTEDIERLEGQTLTSIAGRRVPVVSLAAALRLTEHPDASLTQVVIEIAGEEGGLLVERPELDLDVVVKRLPARLSGATAVLGTALLPGGEVVLVASPSAALRTGAAASARGVSSDASRALTILVVEDSPTTRAMERSILVGAGYDVVVAADGEEAWELLLHRSVDVVVSDVDMPRMDGIALCRAIRDSTRLADLPVILVTSLASDDDRRRGVEAGANGYIVKSAFEQAALLDAVRRFT